MDERISLEVWESGSLQSCKWTDRSRGLEVWMFTSLHAVFDDDKFGSLQVYISCVMLISLEV